MWQVCLTRMPVSVTFSVFSSVSKWLAPHVDLLHATALTHLATHARLMLHPRLQLCHQVPTGFHRTPTVEDSLSHIGEVEVLPITAATVVREVKTTPHWRTVRPSVMHMLSVQHSMCEHPVGGAHIGSLVPLTPFQVQATIATARTDSS